LRKVLIVFAAALAIVPSSAFAADDFWDGFYAGFSLGYGTAAYTWGDTGQDTIFDSLNGAAVGGQAGYMFRLGSVLAGVEVSGLGGSIAQTITDIPTPGKSITFDIGAVAALNARLGVQIGQVMTGGLLIGSGTASSTAPGYTPETEIHTGYDFGGGVEVAVTDQMSVRGEYLYGHLNPRGYTAGGITQQVGVNLQMIRVGADWHF
jgi:outer membrane immunogenic protein